MKLDKIKFASFIGFISCRYALTVTQDDIAKMDAIIDIDVTPVEVPGKANPADLDDLMRAIHKGERIAAIKAYRSMTGYGLKEAKDAVEKEWPEHKRLNEADELYVMLKEGRASAYCQKDAANWIKDLYAGIK